MTQTPLLPERAFAFDLTGLEVPPDTTLVVIVNPNNPNGGSYYGYLALYNVAYVLDDGLMLSLAIVTLSRRKLQERAGRWLKLVSGVVMLGLGTVLIVRPAWLVW